MRERTTISKAELDKHIEGVVRSASECDGVRMHAVRLDKPDESGCNWLVQGMRAPSTGVGCSNAITDALGNLKGYWNLKDE